MNDIVLVSGGFDPVHSGHIRLIQEASELGDVVILLNSDNWLRAKKGKEFLPYKEREIIMSAIKKVIDVISFDIFIIFHISLFLLIKSFRCNPFLTPSTPHRTNPGSTSGIFR